MKETVNIFWFRRDLRLHDNAGLYHALKSGNPVLPIFIFDTLILNHLENNKDPRVEFIHDTLTNVHAELRKINASLKILHGEPLEIFSGLMKTYAIGQVFANHDYELYAIDRDEKVRKALAAAGIEFHTFKDQVIFEKDEALKDDGSPYTVFTPYSRKWKSLAGDFFFKPYPNKKYFKGFLKDGEFSIPTLTSLGFERSGAYFPPSDPPDKLLRDYQQQRDFPGVEGVSRIGIHLRFGTVSIRRLATRANRLSATYLNELIWREFYQMILWHFPKIGKGHAFKKEYDDIAWRNNEEDFERWQTGTTGYPLVDAGMRQINATGFMHNRVRMVVASFLTKHLLIDWRWGEAYFAEKLLDYEFASNNGGWQWAAGSGCDAAPYFRVFNPTLQAKKFDPELKYIRRWVPELGTFDYPAPIVDHEFARKRCLETYARALRK